MLPYRNRKDASRYLLIPYTFPITRRRCLQTFMQTSVFFRTSWIGTIFPMKWCLELRWYLLFYVSKRPKVKPHLWFEQATQQLLLLFVKSQHIYKCWHEGVSYTEHTPCALNGERDAQGTPSKDLNPKNATSGRDPSGSGGQWSAIGSADQLGCLRSLLREERTATN